VHRIAQWVYIDGWANRLQDRQDHEGGIGRHRWTGSIGLRRQPVGAERAVIRILVSGAGIGGLAFVNALNDFDCTIDVVERSTEFRPLGVGIVLHPNAMTALAAIGLSELVREAAAELGWLQLVRGESSLRLSLPEIWSDVPHCTVAIIRYELHRILSRALSNPKVRLRMGTRVAAVTAVEQRPRVHFDDGTVAEYDLIVGSDGIQSGIRGILWPELTPVFTSLIYTRFLARNAVALPRDTWRTSEMEGASFGFIPVSTDLLHCFYQLRAPSVPFAPGDEEKFLLSQAAPGCDDLRRAIAARCGPYHTAMAYMLKPSVWGRGACALLGDAAHAVPPTLSEGGGLAIEDAVVLAQALRGIPTIPQAIKAYEFARNDRVLWIYRMGLSQVNSQRRAPGSKQLDPVIATRHMRAMYAPLRVPLQMPAARSEATKGAE
jgi:2-polyprenyl-6-methoxyphenol hydroxylase-like FAD-dependent oxidoreductase